MTTYTVHLHDQKSPVLVPERFSWGALFLGPLWLLLQGVWIAAVLSGIILFLACTMPPPALRPLLAFGVMLLLGLLGHDLRRGSLALRCFELDGVVTGRNRDEALVRLLSHRAELWESLV